MLAVVAGLAVLAAGAGYYWMTRGTGTPAGATPASTVAPAALTVRARPEVTPPVARTTPQPVTVVSTQPTTAAPLAAPTPAATVAPALPAPTPIPRPTPTSVPPVTLARALPPPPVTQPALTDVRRTPTPTPAAVPAPTTTTTTVAAAPAPNVVRETPVLSAVSPPSVRRPGRVLLDLRGTGLRPDLRVRVVPLKEAPQGITIMRQVCKSPNLFQVLIDLDASVTPGGYAITLADGSGGQTGALTVTVTK